jgi:tetratricopeptide (TPR) repeat protein
MRMASAPTAPMPPGPVKIENDNASDPDLLIDQGRLDDALAAYRAASKKQPNERALRAGIELVEGLKALEHRDRMEAAQRFEAALELDPSNERAARELAEMRRQATNERKGLLSRLMGKKEGPP